MSVSRESIEPKQYFQSTLAFRRSLTRKSIKNLGTEILTRVFYMSNQFHIIQILQSTNEKFVGSSVF